MNFNKKEVYLIVALCILPIVGCIILGKSLVFAFMLGIICSSIIFTKKGFKINELKSIMYKGILECKDLYIVILLIGATVSVWLCSGVVPSMIFYGLEYMKGMNFLFAAFILIAISSVFMGTAVGTISTIGVAILGIGKGFGIPGYILLGAIVSGSFIADKVSPISGLLNLTLATTDINYKEAIKSALNTLVPTIIVCGIIYYVIGSQYQYNAETSSGLLLINAMKKEFFITPYLLLLPIGIIILYVVGIKSIYCMSAGVIGGVVVSLICQDFNIIEIIKFIILGFNINTSSALINETLISGGILGMAEVVLIVIGAISLSSMLQSTGIINHLTKDMISNIKDRKSLILKTGFISSILTIIMCDQTMGIVLPSNLLKSKYEELGVDKNILARTISDTGTIIAPIMPWNVNALIINLVTGISCVSYAPYALLCFISPISTILISFYKTKISPEESSKSKVDNY